MTNILYGKPVADEIEKKINEKIESEGLKLTLAIVQVGDRLDSTTYINRKIAFGARTGVDCRLFKYDLNISESELIEQIKILNANPEITGIIVQVPLPQNINKQNVIESINPKKDVDGLTPTTTFTPATAKGIMSLLEYYNIDILGKQAIIVGRSNLVGLPTAIALEKAGAKVSVIHSQTENPTLISREADILIVAIGKAKQVTKAWIGDKMPVVIDVGINRFEDKLVGDVDFDSVLSFVSAISPVPGGVGPLTVASLFENVLIAGEMVK